MFSGSTRYTVVCGVAILLLTVIVRFPIVLDFLFRNHDEYCTEFLRTDALPGVNHMHGNGMQYFLNENSNNTVA